MAEERGLFITLEGGEGVGKSTLCAGLADRLRGAGHTVLTTREPGGSVGAEAIRRLVLHPPDKHTWISRTEGFLISAARAEHLAVTLRPALDSGTTVLCDRFMDSTRAYQGASGDWSEDELSALEVLTTGTTRPDITLLLDGPPEAFLQRRLSRGLLADGFERRGLAFHRRVRERFLAIAQREPGRVVVIDAVPDADAVLQASWQVLQEHPAFVRLKVGE